MAESGLRPRTQRSIGSARLSDQPESGTSSLGYRLGIPGHSDIGSELDCLFGAEASFLLHQSGSTSPAMRRSCQWAFAKDNASRQYDADALSNAQPYLFIHIIFHACHVLTRRSYLADLVSATHPSTRDSSAENVLAFWQNFAGEMFEHAYCAIDVAWQGTRLNTQPGALSPLMAFCVFQSAAIMTYLLRWFWCKSARPVTVTMQVRFTSLSRYLFQLKVCPASYGRAQISIQRALEMLERLTSRYNMANSWCATIKGAVETARATASSFNTASDARAALAGEHYTVDPLQSVRPPVVKNPPPPSEISRLINNGQEIRASLPSASTSHALAAPYAFPQQGEVDGNDTLADFLPNSDAFDMPLLDSQDLLAFMGDQGIDWSWS